MSLFIGIESRVGAFVDATGDGRRDLVFHGSHPTFSSNLLIAVVPGLGDGTFGEPVVSAGGEDFFDFQVRDVDLD
nr:hypothetical protein [Actinomycetota bacterium]NIU65001.1 hypothetical protein [Actinomycetota bacterium]NIW26807.1 hypothetical protein [Actinomycetota bacterium]NIX19363.1 hypothetical protein [Actinomycetota bacterium]